MGFGIPSMPRTAHKPSSGLEQAQPGDLQRIQRKQFTSIACFALTSKINTVKRTMCSEITCSSPHSGTQEEIFLITKGHHSLQS